MLIKECVYFISPSRDSFLVFLWSYNIFVAKSTSGQCMATNLLCLWGAIGYIHKKSLGEISALLDYFSWSPLIPPKLGDTRVKWLQWPLMSDWSITSMSITEVNVLRTWTETFIIQRLSMRLHNDVKGVLHYCLFGIVANVNQRRFLVCDVIRHPTCRVGWHFIIFFLSPIQVWTYLQVTHPIKTQMSTLAVELKGQQQRTLLVYTNVEHVMSSL